MPAPKLSMPLVLDAFFSVIVMRSVSKSFTMMMSMRTFHATVKTGVSVEYELYAVRLALIPC